MLEIKRSSLSSPELAHSSSHIPLIRSTILPFLNNPSPIGQWVAIEAYVEKELIGLTLSEIYDDGWIRTAQLYSFIVSPSHRQQGVGRTLFSYTQSLLVKEEKIVSFEFFYTQEDPFTPAVEKILASQGWSFPKTLLIRCYFDVTQFNPAWLYREYRFPSSMKIFSWKDLQQNDRKYIEYLAYQRRFVPYLNPFDGEELIDLETSVGLRQDEKIVGWSITQRPNPATICYRTLYIDQDLLYTGLGIHILSESIRRQKALAIPNARLEVNVKEIDASWWRFIKKRLMPLANKVDHIKHAVHLFLEYP